ncbi:hypothetical protein E4U13_008052 [Claviceps humidiphila]|uniref:YTH domain-containing protein n=1 Tax=Claviceps humidiphila TaxID=1294629 RepID=A0A9P7Q827_9HYPO|nr:hypothetical protein E4U13_008052 [Claviceps humidiphila]
MTSAAGFGNPGQLNPHQWHNSHDVASRRIYNEEAMACYPVQQPYHGAFNMAPMASTMPAMSHPPHQSGFYMDMSGQSYNFIASPQITSFGVQTIPLTSYPYNAIPQVQVYPPYGMSHLPYPCGQPGLYAPSNMNMMYYPGQIMDYGQPNYLYPGVAQYQQHAYSMPAPIPWRTHMSGTPNPDMRAFPHVEETAIGSSRSQGNFTRRMVLCSVADSIVDLKARIPKRNVICGPARRPRESGHALWIGNLPPYTDLMTLVEHICKKTVGLESLFLIPKSNCAFANYKDEAACSSALQKLNNSPFQSAFLVCRLKKNVAGCTSRLSATGQGAKAVESTTSNETETKTKASNGESSSASRFTRQIQDRGAVDRFFVLKSLTTEDLNESLKTGMWATQSHNEKTLNAAFQSAANVYLIFSANKSGEYFGYARMMSEIDNKSAAARERAPRAMMTSDVGLPSVPTQASKFAPKGRIIRDSARGTIFWEAERDGHEAGPSRESEARSNGSGTTNEESQTLGKPFRLEWLSTTRLPFCHTGNLRNPWNSGREVKIARDGTEIEPSIGRRLMRLFNRMQMPASFPHRPPPCFVRGY